MKKKKRDTMKLEKIDKKRKKQKKNKWKTQMKIF